MAEAEKEVKVERMGMSFAKIMTVFTVIGIVVMVIPAIFYFMGQNQYISLQVASKYWNEPTAKFWEHVKGKPVHGYSWIFDNLSYTDCQSMIGVLLLMITPLLSMLASMVTAPQKAFKILLLVASIEFVISMVVKGIL